MERVENFCRVPRRGVRGRGRGEEGEEEGGGMGYSRASGIAERIRASGKLSRPRLDNSTGTLVAPRFDIFPASIGIFLRDSILRVSSLFCSLSLSLPLLVFHFTGDSRVEIERCGRNVSRDKLRDIDDPFIRDFFFSFYDPDDFVTQLYRAIVNSYLHARVVNV